MSTGTELVQAAQELYQLQAGPHTMAVLTAAGGVAVFETGKMVFRKLVEPTIDDLFERFQREKEAGNIPEGFETTPHGQKLMQDALNILQQGLDEDRAEAIKKMFLGLAMNPVENSLDRVEQLEILRVTSELQPWELVLMNALDRYRIEVFNKILADEYQNARTDEQRNQVRLLARNGLQPLDEWLHKNFCNGVKSRFISLRDATESLNGKRILTHQWTNGWVDTAADCTISTRGAFTEYGWKIAAHLFAATDGTAA